jgi:V8-like Glu-specific endopeptidase
MELSNQELFEDHSDPKGDYKAKEVRKNQMQRSPYNFIGVVNVCNEDGNEGSVTGFMITSCTVLTSAHALLTFNKNKLVKFEPY